MPLTGGGFQQGLTPIISGIGGTSPGLLEALHGAGGIRAGVLQLNDQAGTVRFLNSDHYGYLRFGSVSPITDEDANSLLAVASGGLLVDGTNWMTGAIQSAASSLLTSRRNLLTAATVGDAFTDNVQNTLLWSSVSVGGAAVNVAAVESGNVLKCHQVTTGTATLSNCYRAYKSQYSLVGNFDIQVDYALSGTYGSADTARHISHFCVVDPSNVGALATFLGGVNSSTPVQLANASVAGIMGNVRNTLAASKFSGYRYVDTTGGESAPVDPAASGKLRITRVGTTITTYMDDGAGGWTQIDTGAWTANDCVVYLTISSYPSASVVANAGWWYTNFVCNSGSPTKATADGPSLVVESLGAEIVTAQSLLSVYNGPSSTADLVFDMGVVLEGAIVTMRATVGKAAEYAGEIKLLGGGVASTKPGAVILQDSQGTPESWYLWQTDGRLRLHSAYPGAEATDGLFVGPPGAGGIYVEDGVTSQTLNATPGVYNKLTGFTTAFASEYGDVDAVAASDQIAVLKKGHYLVTLSMTGSVTEDRTLKFYLYKDGTKVPGLGAHVWYAGTKQGSFSFAGPVACPNGNEVLDIRATGDTGSEVFTPSDAAFTAVRVG